MCSSAISPFCLDFFVCIGDWEQALPIFDMLVKTEKYCMVSEELFVFLSVFFSNVNTWTSLLIEPIFTMVSFREITS